MSHRPKPLPEPIETDIETLTPEGRGIARINGKTVFVDGALPGERVCLRYTRLQRRFDEAVAEVILTPSPQRVVPRCPHFGVCGGCTLQHLDPSAQIRFKQAGLAETLERIGKVSPERWLDPLTAGHWGYRRKARLGVRHVLKKGRVLIGFRERQGSLLADLRHCAVLHPLVGEHLVALAAAIADLTIRDQVPQIEMAMGDGPGVLVVRAMRSPSPEDIERLLRFAAETGLHIYLQEGGIETIRPLPEQGVDLHYSLPGQGIEIGFQPADFTQVNLELNRKMVDQAIALLAPQPDDRVLDLFCGLGNFTLPLARYAREVIGVEGDPGLVERALLNARRNGLENVRFYTADLQADTIIPPWGEGSFDKALIDPPRSGAWAVLDWLPRLGVERLVYVSCYPATLARDAGHLVHGLGYRLCEAGVMDMFPHTSHVESIALFERG
ncbi:23S rRNA (uracil(1939)-C(5))-methyltransferase RlmD [Caldichromatium japonicum]|uniref:23S rRNA (uracil(1939)-C(5))-methyltransferase RlmD n=1 Tax=Caldichromatium japonicum TaxID=2699430 RepID=A0A6G7VE44_9GAMM|nr:23S rRNA (uracil(1939)-C(5))-methyltransferase RlmD [Caldichromatium japonicum]QIK38136.1 23S rRNA (uracil(1939)-C(5))-methyltransferase RlmD [Caldichromatium japonicum]